MGVLNVLHGDGEESVAWCPDSAAQVLTARKRFDEYCRRGFLACRIFGAGRGGVVLREFDPDAEEIFMVGFVDGG